MAAPLESNPTPAPARWRDVIAVGYALTLALLVIGGAIGYVNADRLWKHNSELRQTHAAIVALEGLHSLLKDAETGQRGFLLTSDPQYLQPYEFAVARIPDEIAEVRTLLAEDPLQLQSLDEAQKIFSSKLVELTETIALTRQGDREGALRIVQSNVGKQSMDQLRAIISQMEDREQLRRNRVLSEADTSFRAVVATILSTAGLGMLLVTIVYMLTRRNIKLRHRNAEIVAEQRERLRITLASIGDGVLTTDEHARVTFLNPVAETLTGWSTADAIGLPLERVFHIVNETTREKVNNPAFRALNEGVIVGLANHTVLISRTGMERPIDDSAAPIRLGPKVAGAVLVFRDVSDRRQQEQALVSAHGILASSLDAMSAQLAVLNEAGIILLVNQAWRDWAAATPVNTPGLQVGESYIQLFAQDTTAPSRAATAGIQRVLRGESQDFELEYLRETDPVPQWLLLRASRFSVDDEHRVIVSHENVTERKRAELAAQKRSRETALRADVSTALAVSQPLSTSLQAVCDSLTQHLELSAAHVWVSGAHGGPLELTVSSGARQDWLGQLPSLSHDDEDSDRWLNGSPQRFSGAVASASWHLGDCPPQAVVTTFPLRVEGRLVGLLAAVSDEQAGETLLADLSPLADQVAQHVERKRAEDALQRSEEQFRMLAESIPQMCWMANANGEVFWFNQRWFDFTGIRPEQLGSTDRRMALHDPEIRQLVVDRWQKSLESGQPFDMVFPLKGRDGQFRQFLALAVPLRDEAGKVVRWFGTHTDISESKKVEAELREARSRLDSTLAAGEIGTWEFDLVHDQIRIDQNLAKMLGGNPQLAGGGALQDYLQAIHAADREALMAALTNSMQTGQDFQGDYRLLGPAGQMRWISARGRVEFDAEGKPVRLPGVVVDITAQRQIEDQLRASESRFRLIADTMPQIVWVTQPDGHHEYYNRRWYEFTGVPDGSTDGEGWNGLFHPDDQQRAWDRWNHSLSTGELYEIEYRLRHHSGTYRWFLGRALPVRDDNGEIVKWFGTCTDIEDFKRIEAERQKFVSLAENSTDFIGMADLDGIPFYINHAGLRIVGLESLEQLRTIPVREFFFPEDQSRVVDEFFPAVLRDGNGEIEVRFRHFQTGAAVWMLYRVFAITSPRGPRVILATVSRDITQRRKLEDDLRTLAADLSEAGHRKDEFLATLAHELRNPLAPIRTGLEVMRLSGNDPRIVEEVRATMERQTQQMVRLIDDLLDVSRITQGKLGLRRATVDVADVLRSAVEATRPFIDEAGHELFVKLPLETIWLDADPNRLAQVVSNLLNNSTKYTPDRGRIDLSAQRTGNHVRISVKDNGIGIPQEMQGGIFEMFAQIDRPLEKGYKGLGIGLTLVKRLVEMHGGRIEVRSAGTGQGSEFIVELPAQEEQPASAAPAGSTASSAIQARRRVLVVDDNVAAADMLSVVVGMLGNDVRTAYDGQHAVELAAEFSPDVVLMDIGMPKLNGYEAARHIRQQAWGQTMVLVALTGWGQDEDKLRAREAGFDHHLVKPAEPADLQKLLQSASPRRDLPAEL